MSVRILPAARERVIEIWRYTCERWGADQADRYVQGLHRCMEQASGRRELWKPLRDPRFAGVFSLRCEHHHLFFRELPDGVLAVISILHENMDLPRRLREDFEDPKS